MINIPLEKFEELVDEAVGNIPEEFRKLLDNVDILISDWPTQEDLQSVRAHPQTSLFGLYRGIPKTKRGLYYSGVLPDKITIFAGPILSVSKDEEEAKSLVKKTVIHEIGHYFGMSEEAIRQAESEQALS